MRGIASKAFARGMNVVRLNQRNCGDTEHLSAGLFHSGLTADAAHVIDELAAVDGLPSIAIAGYSLGGNLALKLAGEYGASAPPALCAVAAVSPILEISQCVRALERPGNFLYEWNFVRDLKRRLRRKDKFRPGAFDLSRLGRCARSASSTRPTPRLTSASRMRKTTITAPAPCGSWIGSRSGADHHRRGRSIRAAGSVSRSARDGQSHITLHVCQHGGHCGFVGERRGDDDGYWRRTRSSASSSSSHSTSGRLRQRPSRSTSSRANSGPSLRLRA
jgi:predicted alpha/beta-fold hydrolase